MPRQPTDNPRINVVLGVERKRKLNAAALKLGIGKTELLRRWIDAGCPTEER